MNMGFGDYLGKRLSTKGIAQGFKDFGGGVSKGWKDMSKSLADVDPMATRTARIDPNQFIKPITIENPYEQPVKDMLGKELGPDFAAAQRVGQSQADFAKALESLYGTGAAGLTDLIGTLQKQQTGDFGPGGSLAQKVLEQGLGQNIAGVRSQLASQRGLSPALAARYAAQQTAQLGGQTAQQAGLLGLQQQLAAQQMLGQLTGTAATLGTKAGDIYGTMRGQEIQQATAASDAALKRLNTLVSSDVGIKQLQAQTGMSEQQLRVKIAEANQAAAAGDLKRRNEILSGITGAFSGAAAKAAFSGETGAYSGGRIKGKAPKEGDHPDNDIVPANLSPGEIVIPRSAAGSKKAAKSFIDSLDDWDEEPSYSKVLKARNQKKNYADGGRVEDLTEEQFQKELKDKYGDFRKKQLEQGFDAPIPGVAPMKQSLDEMLTKRVVEPMSKAGYPNVGAAMATVPSTLAEALIPSTAMDLAGPLIPFPGAKLSKKAKDVLKSQETVPKGTMVKEILGQETKSLKEKGPSSFLTKQDSFPDIKPDDLYEFEDELITGAGLKDRLLELSSGDFAMAKWSKVNLNPKQKEILSNITKDNDWINPKQTAALVYQKGDTPEGQKFLKQMIESKSDEPYLGDFTNAVWRTTPGLREMNFPQPIPQQVENLKGVLGKEVPKGGSDPFAWMDTKYEVTKKLLQKNTDTPLTINTRSDLIAHNDYMNLLNPSKHKINIHLLGDMDIDRLSRVMEPGAPSIRRRLDAAKKLSEAGFDVTIVKDVLQNKNMPQELQQMLFKSQPTDGFKVKQNVVNISDEAVENIKKLVGDNFK